MRLLNVETLLVEEFNVRNTPSYAILSHTWGDEEVRLQDMWAGRASSLKGYTKMLGCCEQARNDGLEYVWIDTCCIDRTSSTELTEAINSMFTWYRLSVVCYAYLEDLDADAVREDPALLGKSRWFTRGWTLQELIAPRILVFYGAGWSEMGTRDTLVEHISAATKIDAELFFHGKLYEYSVAQRMSWAAKRETTRVEDGAYCLLGILDVNMPLLYGEGRMAFIRLQEEIMRRSDDQSIFAWRAERSGSGLLAPSVSCFADAGDVRAAHDATHRLPFFTTNKGIQITLPVVQAYNTALPSFETMYSGGSGPTIAITPADCLIVALNCETKSGKTVALALDRKGGDISQENIPYRRINVDLGPLYLSPEFFAGKSSLQTIIVQARDPDNEDLGRPRLGLWTKLRPTFFGIRRHARSEAGFDLVHAFGPAAAEASGAVTASLLDGGRGGAVFARGEAAFGVFVGSTASRSYWELVTGARAAVLALADRFRTKDAYLLSSRPSWRLPLDDGGQHKLEASLEVRSRPHGFSIVFRVEGRTGGKYSEPAVQSFVELRRRGEGAVDKNLIGLREDLESELLLVTPPDLISDFDSSESQL